MSTKRLPHFRHPRKPKRTAEPWPPRWARLPDNPGMIERGERLAPIPGTEAKQLQLFPETA